MLSSRTDFMVVVIGLALAGAAGCAKPHSRIVPGKTTAPELEAALGPAVETRESGLRAGAEIRQYAGNRTYQIEDGVVVAANRDPEPHEGTVRYWRGQWENVETREIELPSVGHEPRRTQLLAPSLRMSVIYETGSGRVTRVVEYGSR